tara:strand:- start:2264 stop:2434 length:171 start_codon:yes stop_codon:yes gene_type:complete
MPNYDQMPETKERDVSEVDDYPDPVGVYIYVSYSGGVRYTQIIDQETGEIVDEYVG